MHASRANHPATHMSNDCSWLMKDANLACKEITWRDPGPNNMYLLANTRSGHLSTVFQSNVIQKTQSEMFGRACMYMIIGKHMKNTFE